MKICKFHVQVKFFFLETCPPRSGIHEKKVVEVFDGTMKLAESEKMSPCWLNFFLPIPFIFILIIVSDGKLRTHEQNREIICACCGK